MRGRGRAPICRRCGRAAVPPLPPASLRPGRLSLPDRDFAYHGGGRGAIVADRLREHSPIVDMSTITLTAGTGVTSVTRSDGVTALQVDVPRALSITIGAGTITNRNVTITGYDYYGQAMSEVIASSASASTTVNGQKAFFQITGITISGGTTGAITVGTTDILGCPVRFNNRGYISRCGWNNVLAEDAATVVVADATTATTTTGDVRGTVVPSSACDGAKRLVVGVLLTAIQCGPNATRAGALGVTQA